MQNTYDVVGGAVFGLPLEYDGYSATDGSVNSDVYIAFTDEVEFTNLQANTTFWLKATQHLYFWVGDSSSDVVDPTTSKAWRLEASKDYYITTTRDAKVLSWCGVAATAGQLFVAKMQSRR